MSVIAQFIGNKSASAVGVLAPMSGVSDLGMRQAAQKFGASLVVSEMVDAGFYARGDAANRIKADGQGIACHVVQVAGCRAPLLAEAARIAEAEGAAAIDINMGCPAKKVVGGYAGSALMRDLDTAVELIRAVVAAVKVPVTVKMRLGWDEGAMNAPDLARRAEAEGVQALTVHGRTRCQFYKGRANWRAIRDIVEAVSIPVIANGDCTSADDARHMLAQSGARGVMIGRASLGRPWLVGEIATELATGRPPVPISGARKREAILAHYATLLSQFGREQGVRHARKHLAAYAQEAGWSGEGAAYRDLVTSCDPDRVLALLTNLYVEPALELAA